MALNVQSGAVREPHIIADEIAERLRLIRTLLSFEADKKSIEVERKVAPHAMSKINRQQRINTTFPCCFASNESHFLDPLVTGNEKWILCYMSTRSQWHTNTSSHYRRQRNLRTRKIYRSVFIGYVRHYPSWPVGTEARHQCAYLALFGDEQQYRMKLLDLMKKHPRLVNIKKVLLYRDNAKVLLRLYRKLVNLARRSFATSFQILPQLIFLYYLPVKIFTQEKK